MDIKNEALRYLGYKGEPDEQTMALILRAEKEFRESVSPSFCWRVMEKSECEHILLGSDIKNHLKDSKRVILFAATLGAAGDRIIRSAEISDMAYAVVADSYASALIEDYCDKCEVEMKAVTGGNFTFRYSAGYGDYPISLQKDFIKLLSADKRIGLTVTENHILIPRKSVTAIIGITEKQREEDRSRCENCNMKDRCLLRKEGSDCGR